MSTSIVLTIDQRRSRATAASRVRFLVGELNREPDLATLLPFEPTIGDELQGVLADPRALPPALRVVSRAGDWWVGIGLGAGAQLAATARESTGEAFVRARAAVERAKRLPWGIAVEAGSSPAAPDLEAGIALWATLLRARTGRGWETVDLRRQGLSEAEIAQQLGITQQAVSQRLRAAYHLQEEEGSRLIARLAARTSADIADDVG